jgi:hypothetical protein
MPINPIHLALLHDGNVLIVAGSGNLATETTLRAVEPSVRHDCDAAAQLGQVLQRHGHPARRPSIPRRWE